MIVHWPGHVPAGRWSDADFASIDWFPTVASLVGMTLDQKTRDWIKVCYTALVSLRHIKGQDASKLLLGKAEAADRRTVPLMWDYRFNMPGHCYHQSPRLAIMDPGWELKLLVNPDMSRVELSVPYCKR